MKSTIFIFTDPEDFKSFDSIRELSEVHYFKSVSMI